MEIYPVTLGGTQRRIINSLTFSGQNAMIQDFLIKLKMLGSQHLLQYYEPFAAFGIDQTQNRDVLLSQASLEWAANELWHGNPFNPTQFNQPYLEDTNETNSCS
jgi:hypothetical protein